MTMEKYGVVDKVAQQKAELLQVRQRLAELRYPNTDLTKSAAAGEYARLQQREAELVKETADQ